MEGDLIQPARKTIIDAPTHGRTDPDRVVVGHWCLFRGAAHVPRSRDFLTIHEAVDARRVAEDVAHRHVVPAPIISDPALGGPAMPAIVALVVGSWRRRKEKTWAG